MIKRIEKVGNKKGKEKVEKKEKKKFGSGGIRTHAIEMTGA